MLTASFGNKTDNENNSGEPADTDVQTADPDANVNTATPEPDGENDPVTDVPEETPDANTTEDPEDVSATPEGGSHLIESGGDIEIIIPTGQGSGGL
jgi:hypothetical protein